MAHSELLNLQTLINKDLSGNLIGMTDYEELLMVEQLQHNIESLKGSISNIEQKQNIKALEIIEQKTFAHFLLSLFGKILTFIICCFPLKNYLSIILCSRKMTEVERVRRVEAISWNYLLVSVICSSIWTSYAFKIQCIEIAIINVFCKYISNFKPYF